MAIREKSNAKRHDEAIFNETRREVTLLAILVGLMVFLFPALQGPYSVVHEPATAFRATRSARIAYVSIVQGALPMQLGRFAALNYLSTTIRGFLCWRTRESSHSTADGDGTIFADRHWSGGRTEPVAKARTHPQRREAGQRPGQLRDG